MSAFIVEPQSVCRIVKWLNEEPDRPALESNPKPCLENYDTLFEFHMARAKWRDKLARDLHAMNLRAVNARYSESNPPELVKYTEPSCATSIQVYKTMRCFLYQCSEGDCPELPLYKSLEAVTYRMAAEIVAELPEYEAAKWE